MIPPRLQQASTTFRREEVEAIVSLLRALYEGRDHRQLIRGTPIASVYGKFVGMRDRLGVVA